MGQEQKGFQYAVTHKNNSKIYDAFSFTEKSDVKEGGNE